MFPRWADRLTYPGGIFLLWVLSAQTVVAEESGRGVINPLATLGKLAVALLIVLTVFWLFARIMRQFQGYQSGVHQGLKVVGALSVGQRERVIVVQAGEEQLVLGVTSTQINTLHVLKTPLSQTSVEAGMGDFKSKLSSALKRLVPS